MNLNKRFIAIRVDGENGLFSPIAQPRLGCEERTAPHRAASCIGRPGPARFRIELEGKAGHADVRGMMTRVLLVDI
jgi:hypothetical protein